MYHNIAEYWRNNSITPLDFERGLVALLQAGFKNYSIKELIEKDFVISGRGFVITFDDAEKGVIHYGLPILKKYNLLGSIFVSPAFISNSYGFSWFKHPKSLIALEEIDKYKGYRMDYMDVDDINTWLDNGFEVGSHGLRHLDLASVSIDTKLLEQEIIESKDCLERIFDIQVDNFCYPFGSFNKVVKEKVKRYYKCAFTVVKDGITSSNFDHYEIPRITGGNAFKSLRDVSQIITSIRK